ncbi:glycine cleavage system protein GcvH [bacterium]|nr:glycine cleavage system protein GcvH [bacterium]
MADKNNILCSSSHEYVYEEENKYYIGLTDYAIEQLGDIVFVELPEVGAEFAKGDIFGTVESVKAASEIYMPVSGKVLEINEQLIESPELLNENAFDEMWLVKVSCDNFADDSKDLTDYSTYKEELE